MKGRGIGQLIDIFSNQGLRVKHTPVTLVSSCILPILILAPGIDRRTTDEATQSTRSFPRACHALSRGAACARDLREWSSPAVLLPHTGAIQLQAGAQYRLYCGAFISLNQFSMCYYLYCIISIILNLHQYEYCYNLCIGIGTIVYSI